MPRSLPLNAATSRKPMIVRFEKHYCTCRQRETLHEVCNAPCCVVCHEYKWGAEPKPIPIEVVHSFEEMEQ